MYDGEQRYAYEHVKSTVGFRIEILNLRHFCFDILYYRLSTYRNMIYNLFNSAPMRTAYGGSDFLI